MVSYTVREKVLLAQLVRETPEIENKRTDGALLAHEKAAWEVVANPYNAEPDCTTPRTAEQLKKLWSNLVKIYRKQKETTDARHEMLRTGGGPPKKPELDPVLQVVSEAAPFMDVTMVCPWDSNAIYEKELRNSASYSSMQVPDPGEAEADECGAFGTIALCLFKVGWDVTFLAIDSRNNVYRYILLISCIFRIFLMGVSNGVS